MLFILATMIASRTVQSFSRLPSFISSRLSSARHLSAAKFDQASSGISNAEGPFFALGVNLAQQVGGQFKGVSEFAA